ncbi:hypothetical protein CYV26_12125 [Carnobacterium maltaromaticum]|uniref:accessory gene regulator B family protein n=1 Tax=Carnobacterium maltaromaticum TaxID=2751 RepID=UPI000C75DDC3|nr:accessory gene regulator B family protein [Carnobacterium maltaromaticum]PLS33848.1 hypothetical protein CYV33_12110 [Carnobacterium maltaromaticum]PLS35829.1 hypothetical protein CYV30_08935 [Carnobacterium maltaromaticum]PLS36279.1 hypothetical protein CYV31_08940 [Carnobacterium maltaromaticum]PLS42736.1 hypothetical protein CYV27_12110 [Carnobacterium maltaromaticum]PLS42972.1 hypothetical protein CYV28_08950 [Carnobacterium maltaromaticum]
MINKICDKVSTKITSNVLPDEAELISFGLYYFIMYSFLGLILCFIGILTKSLIPITIFLLILIPFRRYIGGFHFNNSFFCFFFSIAISLFPIIIYKININQYYLGPPCLLFYVPTLFFSILEHPNKPMTTDEKDSYKLKATKIKYIILLVFFIFSIFSNPYTKIIYVSVITASTLFYVGIFQNYIILKNRKT